MKNKKIIFDALNKEVERQTNWIELIASENYVSKDVLLMQGSEFTNKYAEWYPWKRYYGWCSNVDTVETLTKKLAKELFKTDYSVNVQPHSWSSANMAVYFSVLRPWDKILGLSLNAWWHLTHWSKPNFSWEKYWIFNSFFYWILDDWTFDFKEIRKIALKEKPKMIVAWASAYSRKIDWKQFKNIADEIWAYLLVDMAHIAWLVATGLHATPFGIADFVTTTTHKTLRWPRWWMIFSKNKELWKLIDSAIFPWIQWWPLMHIIAAKWICFSEALNPSYKKYMEQVVKNAKVFEEEFNKAIFVIDWEKKKIKMVWNWTDNHLLLLDFTDLWISWKEVETLLGKIDITTNMNTVPWDLKPWKPSWIRIWTPAITSRGIKEQWIRLIAEAITEIIRSYVYWNDFLEEDIIHWKKTMNNLVKDKTIYPKI